MGRICRAFRVFKILIVVEPTIDDVEGSRREEEGYARTRAVIGETREVDLLLLLFSD